MNKHDPLLHRVLKIFFLGKVDLMCSFKIFWFIWLHWVCIAVFGLSLVVTSGGYSSLQCEDFSLWQLFLLWGTGSRHMCFSNCSPQTFVHGLQSVGSVVAHGWVDPWHVESSQTGAEPMSPALGASLVAQLSSVKYPSAMWETWVQFLGWEDPMEKGKATHSSSLAWRIPWTV